MGKLFHYATKVEWQGNQGAGTTNPQLFSFQHQLLFSGKSPLPGSAAPEFRGDPAAYNPEEMLVGSLSACHMMSFLHLCTLSRLSVQAYTDDASGEMELSSGGIGKFVRVILRPLVTISDPAHEAKLAHLHERAHQVCFISNSVNFPIEIAATVKIQ